MRRGLTVALIGTDGSGKSSVAAALETLADGQARVIYMGLNASRVRHRASLAPMVEKVVIRPSTDFRGGGVETRGRIWAVARLVYRIAEETLRFLVVSWHSARGRMVIMDRHFRFDHAFAPGPDEPLPDRIHAWFLTHLTPLPDLVIFLDVASETALARSGEGSDRYHSKRRNAWKTLAETSEQVIRVDAERPLPEVIAEVEAIVRNADGLR